MKRAAVGPVKRAAAAPMKRAAMCVAIVVVSLLAAVGPRTARAQTAPTIQINADQTVAGVGDIVHVQVTATSSDNMPDSPQIGATPGFVVRGENPSQSQMHSFGSGGMTHSYTLTVDWVLQAQRVGTFRVGPPSFALGGRRYAGQSIALQVVPAGTAPARRQPPSTPQSPFGFSPFDPWRGLFQDFPSPAPPAPPAVTTDPKLSLEAPRDPIYFLHATVDKATAVVGEQVTFSIYEYLDVSSAGVEGEEEHDPQVADFVKHSLLRDDQDPPVAGYAAIGGRTWRVRVLARWALFPLRAGDLVITPMTVSIHADARRRTAFRRETETLHVRATDPPPAGRPPGFAQGNVGRFALRAEVNPRSLTQGGAVDVRVDLSGTGNIPGSVNPPAIEGVEWLTPEVRDSLGAKGHDAYGGERTFDFVVRMKRPGDVDLGQLTLPFFDPDSKRYEVARAPLGIVHVTPSDSPQPSAASSERLPGLPAPRDALENRPQARRHADDSALFWLGAVAGWPLALGVAIGGHAAGRTVARVWRRRRASPAAELRDRIALARAASDGPDARQVDAATVRVLEAAAVASAGINLRGALGDEVARRLEDAGVTHDAAAGLAELLRECEAARFAPEAADLAAARGRWGRAQQTLRLLEKRG